MDNLENQFKDHEKRIRDLELNHIRLGDQISNLCEKLESLIKILKFISTGFCGMLGTLLIFIIEMHIR